MKLQVSQEDEAGTDEDNNDNNDNQERMGWDRMAGWQGGPLFNLANNIDTNVMYYLTQGVQPYFFARFKNIWHEYRPRWAKKCVLGLTMPPH